VNIGFSEGQSRVIMYLEGIPSAGGGLVSLIWVMIVEESFSYSPLGHELQRRGFKRADGRDIMTNALLKGILLL
jgi:hypothetical protein